MSKADLKAAMDSLQVKKPLRLSAPAFSAPPLVSQDTNASLDVSRSPDKKISRDQTNTAVYFEKSNNLDANNPNAQEQKSSWDEKLTKDRNPSQDLDRSQQGTSEDSSGSEDLNSSHVHASSSIPRASQPRRATEQDRAVTEVASVKTRLSTGYTRVPNSLLMEMVSGDLSRNEMKILLIIARMTISFNRKQVPMSKGVIGRMTGIQGRAVLEALQSLQEAGLIEKIPGDCNSPNRLSLVFEPFPQIKAKADQNISQDEVGISDAKDTGQWDANRTYKKDNSETIDLRKKISLSNLSENLRNYFSELKPQRKREAEFQAFEELREEYSDEQIESCFRVLREKGLLSSGAACHSPMAYLSKAIGEVLTHSNSNCEKTQRLIERENREQQARQIAEAATAKELAEWTKKENAFREAFAAGPEREAVLIELCRGSLFRATTVAGRVFAIDRWWESLPEELRR